MRRTFAIPIAAGICLAGLGAGIGIAQAVIPDSSGVIHGCYHPQSDGHNSALGVIDTALSNGHCPSGNTELTWNQTGPAGPAGAQGPAGPPGVSGYQLITQPESYGCSGHTSLSIPAGDVVTGAGVDTPGGSPSQFFSSVTGPDPSDSSKWEFGVEDPSTNIIGNCAGVNVVLWMTVVGSGS
jgi:hypothetical protein